MKKITFFTYNAYPGGGTERTMIMVANELAKKYEIEIISVLKSSEKPFYEISNKIKVIDLNIKKRDPLIVYAIPLWLKIKSKLKNYKTDVVICVGMRYVPFGIFLRKRAKFISWEHYTSYVNKKYTLGDIGRRLSAKKADKIVVLTKRDRANNIKLFKTPEDKIVHIYNAMESKSLSNHYNVDSKKIISAGRVAEQKGYDYLVDVADIVFKKHPDWEWHIFGDGPLKDQIDNKIKEKGLKGNLILKGLCKDLYDRYKEYAMYVLSSRYEGFCMVILEAQNAKLPVVSFNCNCGPDEVIENDVNGFLVDCFNIENMAEKINYLIEHPEKRSEMSLNSSMNDEKLKIETIIKKWEDIIN